MGRRRRKDAEQQVSDLAADDAVMGPVLETLRGIADEAARILIPEEHGDFGGEPVPARSKYGPRMHAQLCRMRLLGLADASAARAVGIAPKTLAEWKERWPKLAHDMETAAELANAHAATILQALMRGGGPTAFQAVRFFLTTHSKEFREPETAAPTIDVNVTLASIRQQIFGLPAENPRRAVEPVAVLDAPEPAAAAKAWDDL